MITILRKVRSLARQPIFVISWIAPVWVMIGLATLAIRLLKTRHLTSVLGRNLGAIGLVPLITPAQERRAVLLKRTLAIASRYAPFRSDCYPQAIVAQQICRIYRLPSTAHFGVRLASKATESRQLLAHAWVVSGRVGITGRSVSFHEYTVVSCFAGPAVWIAPPY